jgi:hypothetical protein
VLEEDKLVLYCSMVPIDKPVCVTVQGLKERQETQEWLLLVCRAIYDLLRSQ